MPALDLPADLFPDCLLQECDISWKPQTQIKKPVVHRFQIYGHFPSVLLNLSASVPGHAAQSIFTSSSTK
jgi:hypothetical protein